MSDSIFMGKVSSSGNNVKFSNTSGNFNGVAGSASYSLTDESSVTMHAGNGDNLLGNLFVDDTSVAYIDADGPARQVDLKGVTGKGTVMMSFGQPGEEMTLAGLSKGFEGTFEGTFGFENANLTIGTDQSVNDSARALASNNVIWVGEGSTLFINNDKAGMIGGDAQKPSLLKMGRDLKLADNSVVDFTKGVYDPDSGYTGNRSGVSANAIDMQGRNLVLSGSSTFRVDVGHLDIASGLPEGGYEGSILDLLGKDVDVPVLAMITNVGGTDTNLEDLAAKITLVGEGVEDQQGIDFYQPTWSSSGAGESVRVAEVKTGVKVVADNNHKGLSVGVGITEIDMVSGATLRIDSSKSTEQDVDHLLDAVIVGDEKSELMITNNMQPSSERDVVTIAANNEEFYGAAEVGLGAHLRLTAADALGSSSSVRVGALNEDEAATVRSTLTVDLSSGHANIKKLTLGRLGDLRLSDSNQLFLTGEGESLLAQGSGVIGSQKSAIVLQSGSMKIEDFSTLAGFEGIFAANAGTKVVFQVDQTDAEHPAYWHNNVLPYADSRARVVGIGEFVKTGAGEIVFDNKTELSGMHLVTREGLTTFEDGAALAGLTAASMQKVNGVLEVGELQGEVGNVFMLDVVTGADVPEGQTGSVVRELGMNGSDGIRVTGVASGVVNFNVTPKDLQKGTEERITLMTANAVEDGNFDVNLVDEKGVALGGLTAGGYDYVLLRDDRMASAGQTGAGTDIYLSSLPDDNGVRNTTVSAGSYLGVAAAGQLFDLSLHDRMSQRSWLQNNADGSISNAFWVIEQVSHERYSDSTGQIDVRDTASTTTVGTDVLSGLAAGGNWYAGAMFGYAVENTKSRSNRTNLESRADTDAWSFGIYAGWQANAADRTGPYADAWVMWTDAESDVNGLNVDETAEGNGLSASIEAGWSFKAANYQAAGATVDVWLEPHASVTWFGYEADDISNDVHDVTFEGKDNIRTKLGVKAYAFSQRSTGFSPFLELNWIHNTETYGVKISNVEVEQAGAEDQAEARLGFDWAINDAWSTWAHFGVAVGDDGYSNREGTVGLRVRF